MEIKVNISEKLLEAVKAYIYEEEWDLYHKDINDFIVEAIVEKFNNDNNIFTGEVDENGFTDGRTPTEHFIEQF